MIEELEVQPRQTATIPQACRSLLHKGPVRDGVFAGAVLIRVDDVPADGAEIIAGQGIYWPTAAGEITVENPSPNFTARILWSSDSDISRASPAPRSLLIYGGTEGWAAAGSETDMLRVALIPAATGGSGKWHDEKAADFRGKPHLIPSGAARRSGTRTTLAVRNLGGAALTLKLYGYAPAGWGVVAAYKHLDTLTLAAGETGVIDEVVDAYTALLLTYEMANLGNIAMCWQIHEGGWFGYTKAEIDALLGLYLPLAGGTLTGDVTFQDAVKAIFRAATEHLASDRPGQLGYHVRDSDEGHEFYSGANLLATLGRHPASHTALRINAPASLSIWAAAAIRFNVTPGVLTAYVKLRMRYDNLAIEYGTTVKAKTYFDGVNYIIHPAVVGAGEVHIGPAGAKTIRAKYKSSDGSAGVTGVFNIPFGPTFTIKDGLVISVV